MRMTGIVLLFVLTVSLPAFAQSAQSPMAVAAEKIAAKDFEGAIALLEELTRSGPPRPPALMLLASAYAQKGDVDAALRTYERLDAYPAFRARAAFEIAAIELARNEPAKALAQLHRIRETGGFDFDQLLSDPRFESLRKQPSFAALIPGPSDFLDPFVEKVRVLHEIRGETKGEQFGWIARRIGDVDGDRIADFVTSAPGFIVDGKPAGRVFVYSGRSGRLLWQVTGKPGEQLGTGLEAAGDTNGDGIPDVIAGAPGAGRAYVWSGRDGRTLLTLGEGESADAFGQHVGAVGDVNGDGCSDVVVGAPGHQKGTGRASLYSGKDGALLLNLEGEKSGDAFGSTVAGAPAGKDRYLLVGAPGAGPHATGRVYVYRGVAPKPLYTFDSDETGGAFGAMFISVVGDVNGDGATDFYVSDWANSARGRSTGRVYLYSGKDGKLLFTLTGEAAGDGFGIGVADAGDVDRDGAADLVIGAWQQGSGAPSGGKVYVYSGRTQRLLRTITCRIPGDTFGFDATNVGDVDGDGVADFLLTSAWSGVNGFHSGRVFVISGKTPAPVTVGVAPGVSVIPGAFVRGQQPDGNTVVFDTKKGLVVVDTGRHESHTRKIADLAHDRGKPVVAIVNTHWHLDHIGGNALLRTEYPGLRVYASAALAEAREGFLARYHGQLEQMIAQSADAAERQSLTTELHLIDSAAALAPDVIVSKSQRLRLGGRPIDVHLEKYAVTAGDLWLYDSATRVVVAGDLVTLPVPFLDTACPSGWSSALDDLAGSGFRVLVPGHGAPMSPADFNVYRSAFRNLVSCAGSPDSKQTCIDGWMRDAASLLKDDDPGFDRSLLDYYVGNVLRGDPEKIRKLCGR